MTDDDDADDDAQEWVDDGHRPPERVETLPASAQGRGDPSDPETWRDTRDGGPDPTRPSSLDDFATEDRPEQPLGETDGESEGAEIGSQGEQDSPGQCVAISASTGERCGRSASEGQMCYTHARMDREDVRTIDDADGGPTPRSLDEDLMPAVTRREGAEE